MKICFFGDAQSVHVQRLASGLAEHGLTVHVVTHKPADIPGVSVEQYCVPPAGLTNPRGWEGRRAHYLHGALRRFDVVNVQFLNDWGFTPEIMRGGRVIATAWGSDIVPPPGEGEPTEELTAARVSLIQHADAVTTCGPSFAKTVAEFGGIDPDRIDVVPFGVDLSLFKRFDALGLRSDARRAPNCPSLAPGAESADSSVDGVQPGQAFRVGFYKGFREVYGPTYLINAIPIVLQHLPETRFDLVGDGPQLEQCREMASDLGIEHAIEWIPRQPQETLPRLIAQWNVTLIPSVSEAFGVSALESSAMGVPVIATDVGGLRDTVRDGNTGMLVTPQSSQALADAVVALLSNKAERAQMGEAGIRWVRHGFSQGDVLDQWIALYRRVMSGVPASV